MEKSINNRFYFDYNATSPLSKNVKAYLESGDLLFGNPASLHQTGKRTRKFINETNQYLFKLFGLSSNDFSLIHHSGATEGINTYFKGIAFHHFKQKEKVSFYLSYFDHACVISLEEDLKALGHDVYFFGADKNGELKKNELLNLLRNDQNNSKYLNYTWVNNETGVIWPLADAVEIKAIPGVFIHVDAVQSVGKITDWEVLNKELDAYTYSAHKFGAIKGVGFSFVNKKSIFYPLIQGGSQQEGLRSGTENALGIYTIKLALEDMKSSFNAEELASAKNFLEQSLKDHYGDRIEILCAGASRRNLNTIFLLVKDQNGQGLSMKFDMQGIELSTGSACSSGIVKENRLAMQLGHTAEISRSTLRFSFMPEMKLADAKVYLEKIKTIF